MTEEEEEEADMPVSAKIDRLASAMTFYNRLYYKAMDQSRSRLLMEIWRKKEQMRNKCEQAFGPKREIGVQHLQTVEVYEDAKCFGDGLTAEYHYKPKVEDNVQEVKYVYHIE